MTLLDTARWVAHACVYGIVAARVVRAVEVAVAFRARRRSR